MRRLSNRPRGQTTRFPPSIPLAIWHFKLFACRHHRIKSQASDDGEDTRKKGKTQQVIDKLPNCAKVLISFFVKYLSRLCSHDCISNFKLICKLLSSQGCAKKFRECVKKKVAKEKKKSKRKNAPVKTEEVSAHISHFIRLLVPIGHCIICIHEHCKACVVLHIGRICRGKNCFVAQYLAFNYFVV